MYHVYSLAVNSRPSGVHQKTGGLWQTNHVNMMGGCRHHCSRLLLLMMNGMSTSITQHPDMMRIMDGVMCRYLIETGCPNLLESAPPLTSHWLGTLDRHMLSTVSMHTCSTIQLDH